MRLLGYALAVSFAATAAASPLKWENSTISANAASSDKKVEVEFTFTNEGDKAVEIRNIRTSCGCTTAAVPKKAFQSGDKGSIPVIFTLGGRKGLQEKTVIVETSNGESDVLTLKVEIPDSFKVNKERLTWEVGDPLEEQNFEIQMLDESSSIKSVKSMNPAFEVNLTEAKNSSYKVSVKPTRTDRPAQGIIRMEVADPAPRSVFLKVLIEG